METAFAWFLNFPFLLAAVTVHEVSHGWVAYRLGDPTAKLSGRLTLNPLRHLDPVGTFLVPLLLLAMRLPVFGWAKPVPVNARNLSRPKQDMIWVGLAGPAANMLLAVLCAALLKLLNPLLPELALGTLRYLILINVILGTFNLLPIPPLDGSRILTGILPLPLARLFVGMERCGILLLILLLYLGILNRIVWPVVVFLAGTLGVF